MFDNLMLLTKQGGILKPFAYILGYILEGIFFVLYKIGIPNIGLAIIIFTIVIYLLLLPLTVKQQKFSKMSAKMNPEIQAIQAKYKGKTDQDSMMKMNQETQMVYQKYGVSPSGSCIQLLIQMPILFALYRVIYSIPAYVGKVKIIFDGLVTKLIASEGSVKVLKKFSSYSMYKKSFKGIDVDKATNMITGTDTSANIEKASNAFIDVLNRASSKDWNNLREAFPNLVEDIDRTTSKLEHYNNFLGLNIGFSPSDIIKHTDSKLIIIGALLIPILAALTQWINVLLMPKPAESKESEQSAMASSMKTMNYVMPIMSAVFCYSLPVGMGIYWIAGSVVRGVIQVVVNKHLDKIDVDEMLKKNIEKTNAKRAKLGLPAMQLTNNATINTKNIEASKPKKTTSAADRAANIKESTDYYNNANASKAGSLASKAMMVKQYNEKNSKSNK